MSATPPIRSCRILAAGDERRSAWSKPRRRLPFHLLVVNRAGEERVEIEGVAVRVPAGGCYLVKAGQLAAITASAGSHPAWVHFDLVHDRHVPARIGWRWFDDPLGRNMPPPSPDPADIFSAAMATRPPAVVERLLVRRLPLVIRQWDAADPLAVIEAENALEGLLVAWARSVRPLPARADLDEQRILRAEAIALESLGRGFGVRAFAAAAGLGRSRFHDLYCALRGEPPGDFLRRMRIASARCLLAAGTSVTETARAVGFADRTTFSRAYARATGRSPGRRG